MREISRQTVLLKLTTDVCRVLTMGQVLGTLQMSHFILTILGNRCCY